ncbi:MAG: DKNYY domain-containing protein [Saprospiraceae bacterium]|nr:DKNYY domain-containing protein [Saprospiraceae bacterium]
MNIQLPIKILALLLFLIFLTSCSSGYQHENGTWVWVSYDESVGRRVKLVESADSETFKVLRNKNYAVDKNAVFYLGIKIEKADPKTFEVITDNGYAIDKSNVSGLGHCFICRPKDLSTSGFSLFEGQNDVYCGIIPLQLNKREINEFIVTNKDDIMAGTKRTILLSYFIEQNPDYAWLDTFDIQRVIIGDWATGETKTRKFKGFREIKTEIPTTPANPSTNSQPER